jgi:hypothetical protein
MPGDPADAVPVNSIAKRKTAPLTFVLRSLRPPMPEATASALAFARSCRKRQNADEHVAEIVAKRLGEPLERAGFVVTKRPADDQAVGLEGNARPLTAPSVRNGRASSSIRNLRGHDFDLRHARMIGT